MMEWLDQKQRHEVVVQMLSPTHLDAIIGELDGVDLSGSSVSASYSTDTRTSGRLRVIGTGYIRNSWLRIIIRYPDSGYERELGTYVVAGEPFKLQGQVYDYELQSLFWAYSQDECAYPLTVGEGAWAMAAAKYELGAYYESDFSKAKDVKLAEAVTYESGTNRLRRLYDLCSMAGNRPDVNGHGTFYALPEDMAVTPEYTIGINDVRGISHGDVERESDFQTRPNRAGVSYSWNDDGEHRIYSHADATGDIAPDARGYVVTDLHTEENMDPPTQAHADEIARDSVSQFRETVTWTLESRYLPIWEGDWVYLDVGDKDPVYSGVRTCIVDDIDIDLLHLDMRLTLKEYL